MDNTIYYILGALFVIYLAINVYNKKNAKRRKSRKFMEGYERRKDDEKAE